MREIFYIERLHAVDLVMYQFGSEKCAPGHFYGPAVRDCYLLHYIHNGCGQFQVNGWTYHLQKGSGFLITPNVVTYYEADGTEPWEYSWVGFQGLKAAEYLQQAGLSTNSPIFQYDRDDLLKDCFRQMMETSKFKRSQEVRLLGFLHLLLSQLIEGAPAGLSSGGTKEAYVQKALDIIAKSYSGKIRISDLANQVSLDRSYLCTLFKEKLFVSPQTFLTRFRIEKACELLGLSELSIGDVARSVGYDDPLLFSKVFHKIKGLSPREYRRINCGKYAVEY